MYAHNASIVDISSIVNLLYNTITQSKNSQLTNFEREIVNS